MTQLTRLYYCVGGHNSLIIGLILTALLWPVTGLQAADRAKFHPPLPGGVIEPVQKFTGKLFAYSSTVGQTDPTPNVTASGAHVADGIVAANCLPFGTRLRIPGLFGDKVFVVQDRMAARYGCTSLDIWHGSYHEAIQFGKRQATVLVLPPSDPRLLVDVTKNKPAYQYSTP